MTLDEKVGQMTQAERGSLDSQAEDIRTYFLGSVLSGGGSGPAENRVEAWSQMYDRFQSKALGTRLKIPILYGIDAVHGHNNVKGAVVFPHNIGLGATRDPDIVEKAARITASEVRATGMNWTFSPCVTVPRDERWGRTYEGFGEDPSLVRTLSEAAVRGYRPAIWPILQVFPPARSIMWGMAGRQAAETRGILRSTRPPCEPSTCRVILERWMPEWRRSWFLSAAGMGSNYRPTSTS
jgi:beta-glucosidase-like glycosyl hydrolase